MCAVRWSGARAGARSGDSIIPNPDPEWAKKNLVAREGPDGVQISTVPVPEMPPELAALFESH